VILNVVFFRTALLEHGNYAVALYIAGEEKVYYIDEVMSAYHNSIG